ncbi:hypothetical protein DFP93_103235 [Aneurinibacillus soli]|uniref:Uncharacterized protein n=1 Tax=Aneurinibacillus soli TaxID=1500254 RepID=A0A0U5BBB1_9BACL|nr:hypothetical protein [Aneurinibacillus soli]PYE63023.1 hypothetical protein DFP93_103235 [Aneurinibacillus soli]BAU28918.1 hypothetical protein CB4_03095 [Aneurinibacillus soli]
MARMNQPSYEKRFARLSGRIEKVFILIILAGVVLVMGSQFLLTFDSFRQSFVETVRLEGVASP